MKATKKYYEIEVCNDHFSHCYQKATKKEAKKWYKKMCKELKGTHNDVILYETKFYGEDEFSRILKYKLYS